MKLQPKIAAFAFFASITYSPANASEEGDWYVAASGGLGQSQEFHTRSVSLPKLTGFAQIQNMLNTGAAHQISEPTALTTQYRWLDAGMVHFRDVPGSEHVRKLVPEHIREHI